MRLLTWIVTGIALCVSASVAAQSVDPALTAAIRGRDEAAINRDPAAMAKYTADDYASIAPNGARMTKRQRVDQLKVPAAPGSKPALPMRTESVGMYGAGAAVVRMKQVDSRHLDVWIKNPSGWQAVAIHVVPDAFLPVQTPLERPKTAEPSGTIAPAGLTGDAAAIFAAHKQIQDATFSGHRAAREKMTAPEYVRLLPGMMRFAGEGANAMDGMPRRQPQFSNATVQVWGQLGVVRWLETGPNGTQWLTRVLAKKPTGWQQVATASSAAGNPTIAP